MALWSLPAAVRAALVAFTVATGGAGIASVAAQESTPGVECVAPDLPPGTPSPMPEEGGPPPVVEGTPEGEAEAEHDMAAMDDASAEAGAGAGAVDEGTAADEATAANAGVIVATPRCPRHRR